MTSPLRAAPGRAPLVDPAPLNRPGGPTCPDWLLLLDDPEPSRVLVVGAAPPATVSWFVDRGAVVDRTDTVPCRPPEHAYDLVVVDEERAARDADHLTALARCCSRGGALRLPGRAHDGLRRRLASLGFTSVRPAGVGAPARALPGRRPTGGLVATRRPAGSVPAWLGAVAGLDQEDEGAGWSLEVPVSYPSRKAVARLPGEGAGLVVKVTRHPRFNVRLDNEATRLTEAAGLGPAVTTAIPAVVASGRVAGLAAVVETTVPGGPFLEASSLRPSCPLAASAARWTTDLAVASTRPLGGAALASRLTGLLDRFEERYAPDAATTRHLRLQVERIGAADDLPGVLFHGDLGTWNLLAHRGRVGVLDWESAEWPGPPLWDLLHLTRSFAVRSGRRRAMRRDRAIRRHLVEGSALTAVVAGWIGDQARALDLDPALVEPLFHTCWVHRAVKESNRLPPGAPGHYGPLCIRLVASRGAPGLRTLLGAAERR